MSNDGDPKRPARRPIRPDPRADDDGASASVDPPRSTPLRRPLGAAAPPIPTPKDDDRRSVPRDDSPPSRRDPRADDADDEPPSRGPLRRPLGAIGAVDTVDTSGAKGARPRPEPAIAPRSNPDPVVARAKPPEPAIALRSNPEPVVTRAKPLRVDELDDLSRSFTTPAALRGVVAGAAPPPIPKIETPAAIAMPVAASAPSLDDDDSPPISARRSPAPAPAPRADADDDAPPSRNDPRARAEQPIPKPAAAPQRLFDSLPAASAVDAPIVDREASTAEAQGAKATAPKPIAQKPAASKPIASPTGAADRSGDRAESQRLAEALARVAELTAKLEEAEKRHATLLVATRSEKDRVLTPDEQKRAAAATAAMSELSMLTTPSASASRPMKTRWIFPLAMLLLGGLALQGNRKPIAKSIAYLRNLPSNTQAKTTTLSIAHFVQIESSLGRLPRPAKFTEWLKRHAETKSSSAWTDPWGRDYRLDARPLPLAVRSAGPDGVFETEDDISAPIY